MSKMKMICFTLWAADSHRSTKGYTLISRVCKLTHAMVIVTVEYICPILTIYTIYLESNQGTKTCSVIKFALTIRHSFSQNV